MISGRLAVWCCRRSHFVTSDLQTPFIHLEQEVRWEAVHISSYSLFQHLGLYAIQFCQITVDLFLFQSLSPKIYFQTAFQRKNASTEADRSAA